MGLFSKRQRTAVPATVIGMLGAYGQAVLDSRRSGHPVTDPRFGWDNFVGPVNMAMLGDDREQVIQDLYNAAVAASDRDHAIFGAYRLLAEFDGALADQRFFKLCDASLDYMHSLGFSSGHLTGYESQRWVEVHGELRSSFDGIVEVAVPSNADAPAVKPLDSGESRMIALTRPLPEGNAFYAEHRADGSYIVFSERRKSNEDPTRARYDETSLGTFADLRDLLRAVGNMFGTRPYWVDEDLEPYFPSRRT